MNPTASIHRKLAGLLSAAAALLILGANARVEAQGKKPKPRPPGPAKSMKIEEVFTCKNYVIVDIKFRDSNGKVTKVKTGTFLYWSNFLKDKRKPQSKRKLDVSQVHEHLSKYTLKLPGVGKVCPPRWAKLKITFKSTEPRLRFVKSWKKKASCR